MNFKYTETSRSSSSPAVKDGFCVRLLVRKSARVKTPLLPHILHFCLLSINNNLSQVGGVHAELFHQKTQGRLKIILHAEGQQGRRACRQLPIMNAGPHVEVKHPYCARARRIDERNKRRHGKRGNLNYT